MRRREERRALDGTRITKAGAEDPGAGLGRAGRSGSGQCDPDRNGTARTTGCAAARRDSLTGCGALRQIEIRRRTVAGRSVGEGPRLQTQGPFSF